MAFYNKLVLTNIGERTLNEALSSGSNLLLSELRLSADVYNQTEVKNLVSLSNTANIIATSSVILEEETDNFIISGSFSNKDITEPLTINSIGLYSILDNTTKLIGVATAIEPIIIKPFRNTVNFYNLKLSLALKQSEYNAIKIIDGNYLDISVLDYYVKKSEMTVEIADLNTQLDEKANLSYVEQAITDTVNAHIVKKNNPHAVTKAQVGLGSVDNIKQATKAEFDTHNADTTKHITAAERTTWNAKQENLTAGANVSISGVVISAVDTVYNDTAVQSHISNKTNPHGITKAQLGLASVTNVAQASKTEFDSHDSNTTKHITASERTAWNNKQNALGFTPENASNKSKAGGYASLDSGGKVPSSELPSYVDDVVEATTLANLPTTGETGKIYVTTGDNKTYRWSGTGYVEISSSLALGTTSSTAYRGDLGNVAYSHSQSSGNPHNTTKAQIGLGNVDNTSDANKPVSTATQSALNNKADKSQVLTNVPANAKFTDTVYTHPSTHPATMIVDDTGHRFVTDTEKNSWNTKTDDATVNAHIAKKDNPHNVTKAQVGLSNVDNTSDLNKPVSTATQDALDLKADKSQVLTDVPANAKFTDTVYTHPSSHPASIITETSIKRFVTDDEKANWNSKTDDTAVNIHIAKKDNPHEVTKTQVGLGNVDNTSDINKPVSSAVQLLLDKKADSSQVLTDVPTNAKFTDTIYTHPSSHPASIITETTTKRFVTDAEKTIWDAKQNELVAGSNVTISGNTISATDTNTTYDVATTTTNGLMAATDKVKLNGIAENANNYSHPVSHPASMITESSSQRFVSDSEKSTWNAKQNALTAGSNVTISGNTISAVNSTYGVATTSSNGLMASTDKTKLDGIANGAQVNPTISTQSQAEAGTDNTTMVTPLRAKQAIEKLAPTPPLASSSVNGLMSSIDKTKLDEIATGANNYSHPSSHPASMITESYTKRFVTDAEKSTWNNKQNALTAGANISISGNTISSVGEAYDVATTSVDGLMSSVDKLKLNGIATGAQVNPSIASQLEALTGTNDTNMMTPLRTKQVILESSPIVVNHGTNSSMARPSGASIVHWIGTVEPINATNNDLWVGGL